MKRILSSVLAIVLFIGAANAQQKGKAKHKEGKAGHEMSMKTADLTIEQQNRVKAINADYRKQVAELKAQSLTAEQMKVKREALHQQHTADIKAVLTAEQRSRVANARVERRNEGSNIRRDSARRDARGRFSKGADGAKRTEMRADLDLSTDQQAKMTSIRSSYKTRLDAVKNDATLSRDEKREKMKELMKAQQEEMKSVLSTEQQSKMKGMRKDAVKRK